MKKKTKIDEVAKEWNDCHFDEKEVSRQDESLKKTADTLGMDLNDLTVLVYDFAVARDLDKIKAWLEVVDNPDVIIDFSRTLQEEDITLKANEKRLSARKIFQLQGLPVGKRMDAYNACRKRLGRFKIPQLKIPCQAYIYKNMDFDKLMILSCLATAFDASHFKDGQTLPLCNFWKILHQSERWDNEPRKEAFEEMVRASIDHLNKYYGDGDGKWFVEMDDDGKIIMKNKPKIWLDLGRKIRLVPTDMMRQKSKLGCIAKLYVIMRVLLCRFSNYPPKMNIETCHQQTGGRESGNMLLGYFKALERLGYVKEPKLEGKCVVWTK